MCESVTAPVLCNICYLNSPSHELFLSLKLQRRCRVPNCINGDGNDLQRRERFDPATSDIIRSSLMNDNVSLPTTSPSPLTSPTTDFPATADKLLLVQPQPIPPAQNEVRSFVPPAEYRPSTTISTVLTNYHVIPPVYALTTSSSSSHPPGLPTRKQNQVERYVKKRRHSSLWLRIIEDPVLYDMTEEEREMTMIEDVIHAVEHPAKRQRLERESEQIPQWATRHQK